MNKLVLTDIEHDTLKEIVSIGAGNASVALSKMIQRKVDIEAPNLWLIPIEEVAGLMGGIEQVMSVIAVNITGDAAGVVLFLFTEEDAARLASTVSSQNKQAVLEETVNIVVGVSLTALSKFLSFRLMQSVPAFASDMLRAVVNEIIAHVGEQTDDVLLLKGSIRVPDVNVNAGLYFLFDPDSSRKVLASCSAHTKKDHE